MLPPISEGTNGTPAHLRKHQVLGLGLTLLLAVLAVAFIVMDPTNADGASALVGGEREFAMEAMEAWRVHCPPTCGTVRCCKKFQAKASGSAQGASSVQAAPPDDHLQKQLSEQQKTAAAQLAKVQQQLKAKDNEVQDLLNKMKNSASKQAVTHTQELTKVKQQLEDLKQQLVSAQKSKADLEQKLAVGAKALQDKEKQYRKALQDKTIAAKAEVQQQTAAATKASQNNAALAAHQKAEKLKSQYDKIHEAALAAVKAAKDKAAAVAANPNSSLQDIEAAQAEIEAADKVFAKTKIEKAQVEGAEKTAEALATPGAAAVLH